MTFGGRCKPFLVLTDVLQTPRSKSQYTACLSMHHRRMPEAFSTRGPAGKAHGKTVRRSAWRKRSALTLARHNMPAEASAFRSPYSQRSNSEASTPSARGSFSAPHMGPPASAPAPSIPQPSGTMSIGSIIEPNMHRSSEYASHHSGPGGLHELAGHPPIGTAPHSLVPELFYGLSPSGDSPLYSSSDSCYSPLSDYLQPQQALPPPFYPQESIQRPERGSIDSCFQPISVHSPMSGTSPTPAWGQYDQASLGFAPEASSLTSVGDDDSNHSKGGHGLTVIIASTIRVLFTLMAGSARRPLLRDGRTASTPALAMDESDLLSSPLRFMTFEYHHQYRYHYRYHYIPTESLRPGNKAINHNHNLTFAASLFGLSIYQCTSMGGRLNHDFTGWKRIVVCCVRVLAGCFDWKRSVCTNRKPEL